MFVLENMGKDEIVAEQQTIERFERKFLNEDEEGERLLLLKNALLAPPVTIETYPAYLGRTEQHAYICTSSATRIFACVLVTLKLVEHLVESGNVVIETTSFQVVEGEFTDNSIVHAIQLWVKRLWPELVVLPEMSLIRYTPDVMHSEKEI
jgi:hypothetical protein